MAGNIRKLSFELLSLVAILRNLENKLPAGNIRKLLMELMLRKFRLPKIKNCLLEEYN